MGGLVRSEQRGTVGRGGIDAGLSGWAVGDALAFEGEV